MKIPFFAAALACAASAACSQNSVGPNPTLTVRGAAGAAPVAAAIRANRVGQVAVATGDPASLRVKMYALYISANADCSAMDLVQDYGTSAAYKDLVQNPLLFSTSASSGSYECVAMRMSDVIEFTPATTFSTCTAGTEYARDVYREGESDWKDVDLNTVVGSGTLDDPVDDHATIFMTTNPTAAIARGISKNQVIPLGGALVIPAATTFYWNGDGTVQDEDGRCSILPGSPSFE
jgi:hypothetical protein